MKMGIVERESGTQRDRQTERQKISNRQYSKMERKTIAKTSIAKVGWNTEKRFIEKEHMRQRE